MFCSAFPHGLLNSKNANILPWVIPFYRNNRRVVCIWMQLVETTINRLMQAPHHSLHPTTNKCHHGNVTHRSIKSYHKRHNRNERHLQNQEHEDSFQYTQKWQQAPITSNNQPQARKQRSENDTGRSHCQESRQCIMTAATAMKSTKSRTRLFSQRTTAHNKH